MGCNYTREGGVISKSPKRTSYTVFYTRSIYKSHAKLHKTGYTMTQQVGPNNRIHGAINSVHLLVIVKGSSKGIKTRCIDARA